MPSNNAGLDEADGYESDIVPCLLDTLFKMKPDSEKLAIIKKGRPMPKMTIIAKDVSKNCTRTFQESWYEMHKWLCGSSQLNKLFCWPCLLMRPESSSWCSTGVDDIKRFATITAKHASCKSHLKAISEYDNTLVLNGLPPAYLDDLTPSFKVEDEQQSNSDDDLFEQYFTDNSRAKKIKKEAEPKKLQTTDATKNESKGRITFKAWREMNGETTSDNIHMSKSILKWRRRAAKQDLYNAKLTSRKLGFEIELLKAKLEYQRALKAELKTHTQPGEKETPRKHNQNEVQSSSVN